MVHRLEIDTALCRYCDKPIHRHNNGTTWSHDNFTDYYDCHNPAEPKKGKTNDDFSGRA
jgi:hypothetical protein